MKIYLGIIIALVVVGGILIVTQNRPSAPAPSPKILEFSQIKTDTANGGQIIDVRTPSEYSAGHIEGSINLSLQDIQAGKMPAVAKNQKIYLYCHSGNRSGQATAILKEAGYTNITDLGAIAHVQSMGGTIVTN